MVSPGNGMVHSGTKHVSHLYLFVPSFSSTENIMLVHGKTVLFNRNNSHDFISSIFKFKVKIE